MKIACADLSAVTVCRIGCNVEYAHILSVSCFFLTELSVWPADYSKCTNTRTHTYFLLNSVGLVLNGQLLEVNTGSRQDAQSVPWLPFPSFLSTPCLWPPLPPWDSLLPACHFPPGRPKPSDELPRARESRLSKGVSYVLTHASKTTRTHTSYCMREPDLPGLGQTIGLVCVIVKNERVAIHLFK